MRRPGGPKLTVATTFPIHPARGGGQTRVVGLYGALAGLGVEVEVVCLAPVDEQPARHELRPGLHEVRVPKSREHHEAERELEARLGVPVTDVVLASHHELTPAYGAALAASARSATATIACHPYATELLLELAPDDVPLLYEAQDVETDIKAALLGDAELCAEVRRLEALTCEKAAHVFVCADQDAVRLGELFGTPAERFATVANGYDANAVAFVDPAARAGRRRSVGLERFDVLFVGSWHGPNLDAARAVLEVARALPDIHALIVGSAGSALLEDDVPENVDITGPVAEPFLQDVLSLADVAVNPMASGSGTNLKMLEYAGAGLPLISTTFGARGLGLAAGEHYLDTEPDALAGAITQLRAEPAPETGRRVGLAYDRVRTHFDWQAIARAWLARDDVRDLLRLPCT